MNTIKLLFISLLLFASCNEEIKAQEHEKRGHLYLEAGGAAGYGSLNYEHFLYKKGIFQTSFRAGISSIHLLDFREKFNPDFCIPLSFHCIFGRSHAFELGIGNTLVNTVIAVDYSTAGRVSNNHASFGVLYRYSMKSVPLVFRIGYTPLLEHYSSWRNWAALSIGIKL